MLNREGNDFVDFVVKEFEELAELFKQKKRAVRRARPACQFPYRRADGKRF